MSLTVDSQNDVAKRDGNDPVSNPAMVEMAAKV